MNTWVRHDLIFLERPESEHVTEGLEDGIPVYLDDLEFYGVDTSVYERHVAFLTPETSDKKLNTSFRMGFRCDHHGSPDEDHSPISVRARLDINFKLQLLVNVVDSAVQIDIKKIILKADESFFDVDVFVNGEGKSLQVIQSRRVPLNDLRPDDFDGLEKICFEKKGMGFIHKNLLIEASKRLNVNLQQIEAIKQAYKNNLDFITKKLGIEDQELLSFLTNLYSDKNYSNDLWTNSAVMLIVALNQATRYLKNEGFLQFRKSTFIDYMNLASLEKLVLVDHKHYGEGFEEAVGSLRSYIRSLPGYVKPLVPGKLEPLNQKTMEHHNFVVAKMLSLLQAVDKK